MSVNTTENKVFSFVAIVFVFAVFAARPAVARYDGGSEEVRTNLSVRMNTETTSNLYNTGSDTQSAAIFKTRITAEIEVPGGPGKYTLNLETEQNDNQKDPDETFRTGTYKFGYERSISEGVTGLLTLSYDETDSPNSAIDTMAGSEISTLGEMRAAISAQDTLSVKFWKGRETYKQYDSMLNKEQGWSASVSRDLGAFTYVEAGFEKRRTRYPGEYVLSPAGGETGATRTDRSAMFTASVSKIIALYPMEYVYAAYEKEDNTSGSSELYLWFDPDTGTLPFKVVPGYDSFDRSALQFYAIKDLSGRDSLSAYYMIENTDYPTRFTGNYGDAEPLTPTSVKLKYLMLSLEHKMSEHIKAEASASWIKYSSNETSWNYDEKIMSFGFNADF